MSRPEFVESWKLFQKWVGRRVKTRNKIVHWERFYDSNGQVVLIDPKISTRRLVASPERPSHVTEKNIRDFTADVQALISVVSEFAALLERKTTSEEAYVDSAELVFDEPSWKTIEELEAELRAAENAND